MTTSDQLQTPIRIAKTLRFVIKGLGLSLLIVLALSFWNLAMADWQHRHNPVPGDFYSINGLQMHIDCRGSGSPAVVLEAAASAPWSSWRKVQPQLSQITKVCTYDRAGHGWSEPRGGTRDAETIARELHSLLNQAGVKVPFIMAGHSAGGLYVREYAREFPSDLAGVVLIDSSSPQQLDELPGFRGLYEEDKRNAWRELWKHRLRVWSGWERLVGHCSVSEKDFLNWAGQYDAMACRPEYVDTDENELNYFERSCQEAARLRSFGKIPLLVISRDPGQPKAGMSERQIAAELVWSQEQEELKSLSPQSWRVIAQHSGHMVQQNKPDTIIREITLLIYYLRGGSAPPFGTTTIN